MLFTKKKIIVKMCLNFFEKFWSHINYTLRVLLEVGEET